MKRIVAGMLLAMLLLAAGAALAVELQPGKTYYLRTPLHAVRGDEISWVNYTSKSERLKAGEKVTITEIGNHVIKFTLTGKEYNFAFTEKGNAGTPALYDKFFSEQDMREEIEKHGEKFRSSIALGRVESGMTKDQVLLVVGCPAIVDSDKTYHMSMKDIKAKDEWTYYYNRFNRWVVTFDQGKVVAIRN